MAVPTSITFRVIPNNAATVVFVRIRKLFNFKKLIVRKDIFDYEPDCEGKFIFYEEVFSFPKAISNKKGLYGFNATMRAVV